LLVPVSEAILQQFAGHFQTAAQAVVVAPAATDPIAASPTASEPHPAEPISLPADRVPPSASAQTGAPSSEPASELNALALIWMVIKGWFASLFGKKS
jgi:hypothetical protein